MTIEYLPYYGYRGYPFPWHQQFLAQRSLRLITAATQEHFTIEECRAHLKLDTYGSPESHPDDEMIMGVYLPAARSICESISGRSFVTQTYELGIGSFPYSYVAYNRNGISLGIGPVRGVTSVIYNDGTSDVTLDGSSYLVDPYTDGGYIYAAYGSSWPSAAMIPNAVRVRFTAGYDVSGSSPEDFIMPAQYKWAMLLALTAVYNNRSNLTELKLEEMPMGLKSLLGPDSLVNGFA